MYLVLCLLVAATHLWGAEGQLILMRHGQSEHNVQDVYNSNPTSSNYTPSHLTTEGTAQALQTAQALLKQGFNRDSIGVVYVSPLPRAQETARVLVKAGLISEKSIVIDERLTEIQVGELEGLPIIRPWSEALTAQYRTETSEQLHERMSAFYNDHLALQSNKNIFVITHAFPAHELMKLMNAGKEEKIGVGQAIVIAFPQNH